MRVRAAVYRKIAMMGAIAASIMALTAPAALAGTPHATDDGTWVRQAQEHTIETVDFSRTDAAHIWGVGPFGRVLNTSDGGQSWNLYNVGDIAAVLHSVDFVDNQTGWTVGEGMSGGGFVFKTTDGGASWFRQNEPSGQRVFGVEALDPQTVMIVGGGTSFTIARRSTDGGQTWQFMDVPLNDGIFLDIFFVDNSTGWITGLNGGIAKTTDGGVTWTAQSRPTNWGMVRIHFSDPQNGWAGGYYGVLLHTTNGGQTWIQQNAQLPEYTHVLGVATINPNVAWISGYGGGAQSRPFVKQTTDGGATWVDRTPSVGPYDGFASALFLDEENGWAAGAAGLWRRSGSAPPPPQPTATATSTSIPTATGIATSAPTMTAIAATQTATNVPAATSTAVSTSTPVAPSSTPVATATSTVAPQACEVVFTDVAPTDYFYEGVRTLACMGAISGYEDNTFRPYANATRGQLTKILALAEGWEIELSNGPHFSDVLPGSTFYPYVETAFNRGVIGGYPDGTFRPNSNVTRGQIAKIVVLARGWTLSTGEQHFSDVPAGSAFHSYIETAYGHGIINGYTDGTFRPQSPATRGQIAKIVDLALAGDR
jgi:photosystem II stability/assembly factor-like uncharacterized protein